VKYWDEKNWHVFSTKVVQFFPTFFRDGFRFNFFFSAWCAFRSWTDFVVRTWNSVRPASGKTWPRSKIRLTTVRISRLIIWSPEVLLLLLLVLLFLLLLKLILLLLKFWSGWSSFVLVRFWRGWTNTLWLVTRQRILIGKETFENLYNSMVNFINILHVRIFRTKVLCTAFL